MIRFGLLMPALALVVPTPAAALCIYNGRYNAKTTVNQEFVDAHWVIRAKVISAVDGEVESGKPDAGMAWTSYRLQVVHSFKGTPPRTLRFFTMRNSGGFYMDRPWASLPKGHDVGGEYLLFLNPIEAYKGQPNAEKGAVFVNYSCGQSKPWREVDKRTHQQLAGLSKS